MSFGTRLTHRLMAPAWKLVPIRVPQIETGPGCVSKLGELCTSEKVKKVLIVTDNVLPSLGLLDSTFEALQKSGIEYVLFDKVTPDPDIHTCIEGCKLYTSEKCEAMIAFGGGSSMDCAKYIQILSTDPDGDPFSYLGMFQLSPFKSLPLLIAIPTTAGTGSETTIAAIISDKANQVKYAVTDLRLSPPYAYLDPLLLKKLPKAITAATGIDALTHAVESYLSTFRTDFTMEYSLRAIKNIFEFLPKAYDNGEDIEARTKTLKASFDAGVAFTRTSVGYVHAVAHQLGALFHTPHGEANAIVIAHVLDFYNDKQNTFAMNALAKMCLVVEGRPDDPVLNSDRDELASRFIKHVRDLCDYVNIPKFVKGMPRNMVDEIVDRALREAHGKSFDFMKNPLKAMLDVGYPVPKYMNKEQCEQIVAKIVDPTAPMHSKL